jgi:nicotinate-nucleotide pyrophosphorylase (carboxylating)
MSFSLDRFDLDAFVASTLAEDLGDHGDITSAAVIPADAIFTASMRSREAVTVAGLPLAEAMFRALDPDIQIEVLVRDGDPASARTELM